MQNLGGQTKSIMVFSGVAYSNDRKKTFRIILTTTRFIIPRKKKEKTTRINTTYVGHKATYKITGKLI